MVLSTQLLANSVQKQPSFLSAATTLQKANANGGAGGDGVKLGKSFPDSFVVVGAVAGTLAPSSHLARAQPARL